MANQMDNPVFRQESRRLIVSVDKEGRTYTASIYWKLFKQVKSQQTFTSKAKAIAWCKQKDKEVNGFCNGLVTHLKAIPKRSLTKTVKSLIKESGK